MQNYFSKSMMFMFLIFFLILLIPGCNRTDENKTEVAKSEEKTTVPEKTKDDETIKRMNSLNKKMTKFLILYIDGTLEEFRAHKDPRGLYPLETDSEDGNGTEELVRILGMNGAGLFDFKDSQLTRGKDGEGDPQLADGWGRPMRYRPWRGKADKTGAHNKKTYDLWSAGADGKWGTKDDITNWKKE